jgi:hypothetical protein
MAEENKQENTAETYFDAVSRSQGSNCDAEGLGMVALGPFVIGRVDAINGRGGEEVTEFVATRHELERLAAYWLTERLDLDFDYFVSQSSGSSEWRWSTYIERRLDRLYGILGKAAIDKRSPTRPPVGASSTRSMTRTGACSGRETTRNERSGAGKNSRLKSHLTGSSPFVFTPFSNRSRPSIGLPVNDLIRLLHRILEADLRLGRCMSPTLQINACAGRGSKNGDTFYVRQIAAHG